GPLHAALPEGPLHPALPPGETPPRLSAQAAGAPRLASPGAPRATGAAPPAGEGSAPASEPCWRSASTRSPPTCSSGSCPSPAWCARSAWITRGGSTCNGRRWPCSPCRRPPKRFSSSCWRMPTSVPSTPIGSPSTPRTFSWLGGSGAFRAAWASILPPREQRKGNREHPRNCHVLRGLLQAGSGWLGPKSPCQGGSAASALWLPPFSRLLPAPAPP
ncbi:Hypothetical predicted protein, partial [Podarcis lilfordi]